MRKSKGFTLIELVVVIAILGILAGIAIPRFMDAQAAARGSRIVADLRTIDSAATIYYAKNGKYPDVITTSSPASSDGFIGANLAAWPVPNVGTFIVNQYNGTNKTFNNVTAAYYTLTSDGRGRYNGHNVDWYLGGVEENAVASSLVNWLNQEKSALFDLLTTTVPNMDSENTNPRAYGPTVIGILKEQGIDTSNSSWALRYNKTTKTISVSVTDHKLTNSDVGKTIDTQVYTGTVTSTGTISWNTPTRSTASAITVKDSKSNSTYVTINV